MTSLNARATAYKSCTNTTFSAYLMVDAIAFVDEMPEQTKPRARCLGVVIVLHYGRDIAHGGAVPGLDAVGRVGSGLAGQAIHLKGNSDVQMF